MNRRLANKRIERLERMIAQRKRQAVSADWERSPCMISHIAWQDRHLGRECAFLVITPGLLRNYLESDACLFVDVARNLARLFPSRFRLAIRGKGPDTDPKIQAAAKEWSEEELSIVADVLTDEGLLEGDDPADEGEPEEAFSF